MDGQTHELVDILWRWFVIRGPGRAMVNLPTKFEVSTANYSPAHVTRVDNALGRHVQWSIAEIFGSNKTKSLGYHTGLFL